MLDDFPISAEQLLGSLTKLRGSQEADMNGQASPARKDLITAQCEVQYKKRCCLSYSDRHQKPSIRTICIDSTLGRIARTTTLH